MTKHHDFMIRCLELAKNGCGHVAPNPMVGSVIVYDNIIIGEGYHKYPGSPHAEANAISSVKDKSLLPHSTLYVNLEPCSHHGRTPPCSDLIISHKIPKVVVGSADPNPKVAGRGLEQLRRNGCEVITGIAEHESRYLNRRFLTFHTKKRPYIILKWAQTVDGFIDVVRSRSNDPKPTWITSENLRLLVHKWRAEESAIMAGTNTLLYDNPRLNVREWHGKQPIRIILDRNNSLPASLHVFDQTQQTWVFNASREGQSENTRWIKIPFDNQSLQHIMDYLYQHEVQSVFVEGGRILHQSFINAGLWDEARVFYGQQFFGQGIPAPNLPATDSDVTHFGKELLHVFTAKA